MMAWLRVCSQAYVSVLATFISAIRYKSPCGTDPLRSCSVSSGLFASSCSFCTSVMGAMAFRM